MAGRGREEGELVVVVVGCGVGVDGEGAAVSGSRERVCGAECKTQRVHAVGEQGLQLGGCQH